MKKLVAANNVILSAGGGQTIDGAASVTWATRYQSYTIIAPDAGTDWGII